MFILNQSHRSILIAHKISTCRKYTQSNMLNKHLTFDFVRRAYRDFVASASSFMHGKYFSELLQANKRN